MIMNKINLQIFPTLDFQQLAESLRQVEMTLIETIKKIEININNLENINAYCYYSMAIAGSIFLLIVVYTNGHSNTNFNRRYPTAFYTQPYPIRRRQADPLLWKVTAMKRLGYELGVSDERWPDHIRFTPADREEFIMRMTQSSLYRRYFVNTPWGCRGIIALSWNLEFFTRYSAEVRPTTALTLNLARTRPRRLWANWNIAEVYDGPMWRRGR